MGGKWLKFWMIKTNINIYQSYCEEPQNNVQWKWNHCWTFDHLISTFLKQNGKEILKDEKNMMKDWSGMMKRAKLELANKWKWKYRKGGGAWGD